MTSLILGLMLGSLLVVMYFQLSRARKRHKERKKFDINDYRKN